MPGSLVHRAPVRLCVGLACVLSLWNTVSAIKEEAKKENVMTFLPTTVENKEVKKEKAGAFLGATELPARSVDLSALNLTQVVNGMLSRVLKDSKKFFSLLSITSYSSFAFHKVSVAIYNISHLKTVDPAKFPPRHCYCVNNRTNDLSDFTALLVDFIGNSTSYLTEIFKSTSILSVSQTNESDCIFICVMTGKSGRNLSDFWEVADESPVINYTFTSSLSGVLVTRGTAAASSLSPTSQQTLPRTSPPPTARSTSGSALRASPRSEATRPSEGQQTVNTDRLPELLAKATATPGSVPSTLPGVATRRATANRPSQQVWASSPPMPWTQTTREEAPGGPPWEPLSSRAVSPAEAQQTARTQTTGGLPGPPGGTQGSPSPASPTSEMTSPAPRPPPQLNWAPTSFAHIEHPPPAHRLQVRPRPRPPGTHRQLISCGHLPLEKSQPWSLDPTKFKFQLLREGTMTASPVTLAVQKLNPCLMELCRFFQHCLCMSQRRDPRVQAVRFCLEYYSWFLKNATYICQKAKRVPHSHTLKQRCLENVCKSV